MMRRILFLVALGVMAAFCVSAQSIGPDVYHPKTIDPKARLTLSPPGVTLALPAPPTTELPALSDAEIPPETGFGPERIGVHRKLIATVAEAGRADGQPLGGWTVLNTGERLWRMAIHSPGSYGLRIHFEDFDAGEGNVWVYAASADTGTWAGPYQARGPNGDGDFWSDIVVADTVVIEYAPERAAQVDTRIPFRVQQISHVWRDLGLFDPGRRAAKDSGGIKRAGGPSPSIAAPCSVDAACFPNWADTARAVARIVIELGGGPFFCSGTLLNDTGNENRLHFLTAAHCVPDQQTARTLIAYWFYQTSTCNGSPPTENSVPRTFGARLLASRGGGLVDARGDFALLLLNDAPANVMLSGWDAAPAAPQREATGIHHPRGDYKRITFGRTTPDATFPDAYVRVLETRGVTQPGSSGSGLFKAPGLLIGALSFGPRPPPGLTECAVAPGWRGYQRFSEAYPALRAFLDPQTAPPPPAANPPGGDLRLGGTDTFTLDPVSAPTLFTGDFAYRFEAPADVARVTVSVEATDPRSADIDLYVRAGQAPADSNGQITSDFRSEAAAGTEQITIDARSNPPLRLGTYFVAIRARTLNTAVKGTIRLTFERTPPPPAPTGVRLTSGQAVPFTLPAVESPTLFAGPSTYSVEVPEGAQRLDVVVSTTSAGADVDLYVRFGDRPVISGGRVVADLSSVSPSGQELLTITASNGLRPGTYHIALGLYSTGIKAEGTVKADVTTRSDAPQPATPIAQDTPQRVDLPAVNAPSFFPDRIYRFDVEEAVSRLIVDLETSSANVDVDLYVRYGRPPELVQGRVLSTYSSENAGGREQIVVSAVSSPPLQPGSYYIGLVLHSMGQPASTQIRVTAERTAAGRPHIAATVSAASYQPGHVAPGQIVSLFGSAIGPAEGIAAQLDPQTGRLRTELGGVSVLFDGLAAPLFYVRGDQINVQVPYGVSNLLTTNVRVVANGQSSNVVTVPVRASAPAVFLAGGDAARIVAINQDGSINSPARPARRGEVVVFYATGEGSTNPPASDGGLAPAAEPLQRPVAQPVAVRFGSSFGDVLFAGSAPGFAGLLQLNVRIGPEAPTGDAVPVQLAVGGEFSQPGATISIASGGPAGSTAYWISTYAGNGSGSSSGDGGPATSAGVGLPFGVAVDPAGNVYIAELFGSRVRKVSPDGVISTFAGTGVGGYSGDGGPAAAAQIFQPAGLAVDRAGNLYIADVVGHRIRKVTPAGIITTFAGGGSGGDGSATQALVNAPAGLAFDPQGNLLVAETGSGLIRRITPDGMLSTVIDGLDRPDNVAIDLAGNIYIAEFALVQRLDTTGLLTPFYDKLRPLVAADQSGNVYLSDYNTGQVLKVAVAGALTTIAGTGIGGFSGDGGPATQAQLAGVRAMAFGAAGEIYIAEAFNNRVRKLTPGPAPNPAEPTNPANPTTSTIALELVPYTQTTLVYDDTWFFDVPAGAAELTVRLTTETAGVDLDLYVRLGSHPDLANGRTVADHISSGSSGSETITITGSALRAGRYYFAVGQFTLNRPTTASVTGTIRF